MKLVHLLLVGGLVGFAGPAAASDMPGSDCAQLTEADQRAICESVDLTRLDTEAATLYEVRMMLPMLMGERGAAQDENQAFIEQRQACGADVSCLTSAYQARISALKATIQTGMDEFCELKGICG